MTDQEIAQVRKESANAVLRSILADKNPTNTVKLYQYNIRLWQVCKYLDLQNAYYPFFFYCMT